MLSIEYPGFFVRGVLGELTSQPPYILFCHRRMNYSDAIVYLKEHNIRKEDGTFYEFGEVWCNVTWPCLSPYHTCQIQICLESSCVIVTALFPWNGKIPCDNKLILKFKKEAWYEQNNCKANIFLKIAANHHFEFLTIHFVCYHGSMQEI